MKHDYSNYITQYNIRNFSTNTQKIKKNSAFIAIKGNIYDGNNFIEEAIARGAGIIFTESPEYAAKFEDKAKMILVDNARKTVAELSAAIYAHVPEDLIAITGTNGKSSTVHYIGLLASLMDIKAASIGTLGVRLYGAREHGYKDLGLTTVDSITLGEELENLHRENVKLCAIEASSIGLEQYRLYGRKFKIAGFASFSQDHLDYHGSMESYLKAKLKLFSEHQDDNGIAIINADMGAIEEIKAFLKEIGRKFITYGVKGDYMIKSIKSHILGQSFTLQTPFGEHHIEIPVIGEFQIGNIVLAIITLVNLGYDFHDILHHVHKLTPPKGRLEQVGEGDIARRIFIDYAHSPDALENVLKELRQASDNSGGKLWVVFGCGGDRDRSKRPLMGKIAATLADYAVVTDDNPRSENPSAIRKEIIGEATTLREIGNRRDAIKYAIDNMGDHDIILIAGKGHEEYQIIGSQEYYFSDKKTCEEILAASQLL